MLPSAASSAVACRSRAYCGSASTPTAFARRTCSGSVSPSALSDPATWFRAVSNASASGVLVTARISLVPSRRSSAHTPRFSAALRARSAASVGIVALDSRPAPPA